jgi:hypothetical protein
LLSFKLRYWKADQKWKAPKPDASKELGIEVAINSTHHARTPIPLERLKDESKVMASHYIEADYSFSVC